jgi:hypothetical protein
MLANLSMTPVSAVPPAILARVQALLPTTALASPTDVSLPRGSTGKSFGLLCLLV